jgi:hypothetical protein
MVNWTLRAEPPLKTERKPRQPKPQIAIPSTHEVFNGHAVRRINAIHFDVISLESGRNYRITMRADGSTDCGCTRRRFASDCAHSYAVFRLIAAEAGPNRATRRALMTSDNPGDPELFD